LSKSLGFERHCSRGTFKPTKGGHPKTATPLIERPGAGDGTGSRRVNKVGDEISGGYLRRYLEMLFSELKTKEKTSCQPQS
jgi:hypothetical protein